MTHGKTLPINYYNESEVLQVLPSSPNLSSAKLGWTDFVLTHYSHPANETEEHYGEQHIITVILRKPAKIYHSLEGRFFSHVLQPGDVTLCPAGFSQWAAWNEEVEFLMLNVEPESVKQFLYGQGYTQKFELLPRIMAKDFLIQQIVKTLAQEATSGGKRGQLYVESLFNLLAAHLQRFHTIHTPELPEHFQHRTQRQLQPAIDYLYDRIQEDPSLTDLAAILKMSPYQVVQLFKQTTGFTPLQFLLRCRVERARQLLKNPNLSMMDVAIQAGFSSISLFERHFYSIAGITPTAYREN
ncbi:MAG: AraC family transcriptional regulator [Hydrococcus sp. Prado102]|jgi:AraC family transcriptional regulator|nr:AraC family transcriptional regulator [Hydrococcus sp. Prado102]